MALARRFAEIMDERKWEREQQIRRAAYQVWDGWNYRRLLAKEQGKEFN